MELSISESPWLSAYWFARMLINGDKYANVGTSKESQMLTLVAKLESVLAQESLDSNEKIKVCKRTLKKGLSELFKQGAKSYSLSLNLAEDIIAELNSTIDITVFILSMKYMVTPINMALTAVPSSDLKFCLETAQNILDELGEEAVGKVIATWDNLGVKGCLSAERSLVIAEFTKLRNMLKTLNITNTEIEDNMILTAFVQEFERRLGQKRKNRAGTSLEYVLTFLFDRYGFKSHPKPDHFQTDIEVDNM